MVIWQVETSWNPEPSTTTKTPLPLKCERPLRISIWPRNKIKSRCTKETSAQATSSIASDQASTKRRITPITFSQYNKIPREVLFSTKTQALSKTTTSKCFIIQKITEDRLPKMLCQSKASARLSLPRTILIPRTPLAKIG